MVHNLDTGTIHEASFMHTLNLEHAADESPPGPSPPSMRVLLPTRRLLAPAIIPTRPPAMQRRRRPPLRLRGLPEENAARVGTESKKKMD